MKILGHITPLVILAFVAIGCGDSNASVERQKNLNAAMANVMKALNAANASASTQDTDLDGQIARIGSEASHPAADKSVTYEMLKKNADKYAGRPWEFKGKVLEISEKNGVTIARISLDDFGGKPVWCQGNITSDVVEKDRVIATGYLAGEKSYTSQANWNISIPAMALSSLKKAK